MTWVDGDDIIIIMKGREPMPNSVEKTMMILRSVSDGKGKPVTLERMSKDTHINKSTLAHIVLTLCKNGYLRKVSHNEGYIIGPELHILTRYGRYGEDIISIIHPILEYINRKTGHTAVFAILGGDKKYIIDRACTSETYSDSDANILGDDIYRTVTGRVLLANITADKALEVLGTLGAPDKISWKEASDIDGYLSQLRMIHDTECYYIKHPNGDCIWHSFALPIYRGKDCLGALGLALKLEDTAQNRNIDTQKYNSLMIKCKKELERRLRFS